VDGCVLGLSFPKGWAFLWLNKDGTLEGADEEPIEGPEGRRLWSLSQSGIYLAHLGGGSFTLATYDKEGKPLRLDLKPCYFDNVEIRSMTAYPEQVDSFASAVGAHEAMFGVPGWEGVVVFDSSGQMILGLAENANNNCTLSVDWEGLSEECPNNPPAYRVWVGKTSKDDPSNHDEYIVKATTQPNLDVFFRAWDIDDPSSGTGPVDPNDQVLGRHAGQDNRYVPAPYREGKWTSGEPGNDTIKRTADASGIARATLQVTPRPGDNFLITASCGTDKVSGLSYPGNIDPSDYPPGVAVSKPITVWRLLHINLSSMPDDTSHINEAEDGAWETIDDAYYNGTLTRLEVDDFDADEEENDHFNNGVIRIYDPENLYYNHIVVDTQVFSSSDEYVFISGNHEDYEGLQYRLVDDDNNDNALLTLKVAYPLTPDVSALDGALKPCYMKSKPYDRTTRAVFDPNAHNDEACAYISDSAHYTLHPAISDYFFTCHVVAAHQSPPRLAYDGEDLDPGPGDSAAYPEGAVVGITQIALHGLCIYYEPIREIGTRPVPVEELTIVHEIGHECGAAHDAGNGHVMEPLIPDVSTISFADKAQDEIRSQVWPPTVPGQDVLWWDGP
jgi:hypothetical protein